MEEETQRILEMVQARRISPDQASKLLDALDAAAAQPARPRRARTLRVNVTDTRSGRTKVNVSIPLSLVEMASKMGISLGMMNDRRFPDVSIDEIMAAIRNGVEGKVIDIEDDKERQHVVITLE